MGYTEDHQKIKTMFITERDDSVASEVTSKSIVKSISYLEEYVGILASGGGPMMGEGCIEQLSTCLDSIVENTQG